MSTQRHSVCASHPIIGARGGLRTVLAEVERLLGLPVNVLVQGESGTGKELIARALHQRDPQRCHHSFVALNCAALPAALLEAELFGYCRGAFTGATRDHRGLFEEAEGGTLFLDEIGELPPALQPRLLRALQEGAVRRLGESRERAVDLRVVAATHKDLHLAMAAGHFRPDLYYRLADYLIRVPPLCQRRQDILPLARHFLHTYARAFGRPRLRRLSAAAGVWLESCDWSHNNVRELSVVLKRAVLLCEGEQIEVEHLRMELQPAPAVGPPHYPERRRLEAALAQTGGNIAAAARLLDMKRSTLFDRLEKMGLRQKYRGA